MADNDSRSIDRTGDPTPCFATAAEIAMAERLRHEIEARYLAPGKPAGPPSPYGSERR